MHDWTGLICEVHILVLFLEIITMEASAYCHLSRSNTLGRRTLSTFLNFAQDEVISLLDENYQQDAINISFREFISQQEASSADILRQTVYELFMNGNKSAQKQSSLHCVL